MVTDRFHDGSAENALTRLAQEAQEALQIGRARVEDVTEKFNEASKLLQPGQLIKDDFFTLFEAVSALEVER